MRNLPRIRRSSYFLLIPGAACLLFSGSLDYLWFEAALLGLILLAVWLLRGKSKWSARPPQWCSPMRRWSRNPALACTLPAVVSVALRLALLPWIPSPDPVVPDEFSHLFLAKTFLLGRLANPSHPLWMHFETIHIISQPTFSSMYMAGQACFLVAGKLLTGSFFGGVLISTALFCAALTWFLRAYVPPGWALYGGLLAAVRIGAASYWNNSYWGGSAGALGGALALGAYARLVKGWRPGKAIVFTVGLILLANTRPYEGAGLALALGSAVAWDFLKNRERVPWKSLAWSLAISCVLLAAAGWGMTRQWKAVTGSALTMPYQVNQQTYGWPMTLPWMKARPVEYRHPEFAYYHDWEMKEHQLITDPAMIPLGLLMKSSFLWRFFLGISLSATLLFANQIFRMRRPRMVWIAGAVVLLMDLTEQSGYPHYFAPAAPAVALFAVLGLRYLAQWRVRGVAFGPAIVRWAVPVMFGVIGLRAAVLSPDNPTSDKISWCCTDQRALDREPILRELEAHPGKHLVLVSYDLQSYETLEWVYNEPDIDSAKVVFARDMGPEKNQELLNYYPDRHVWKLRLTHAEAILSPEFGPAISMALAHDGTR